VWHPKDCSVTAQTAPARLGLTEAVRLSQTRYVVQLPNSSILSSGTAAQNVTPGPSLTETGTCDSDGATPVCCNFSVSLAGSGNYELLMMSLG